MTTRDFASHCADVQRRHASRPPDAARPETPFCLDDGHGHRIDALQQVRTTLLGLVTMLVLLAAAITAIWTTGTPLLVLLAVKVVCLLTWLLRTRSQQRLARAWQQEAGAWPAALVMAHNSVLEPGNSVVPGTMLVDFGKSPAAERLEHAAAACYALLDAEHVPPHHTAIRDWLRLEMQRARYGRIRVPTDLAGNDTSWLVSLRFDRAMMPAGHVDRRFWFVKARPDRNESAEILPASYWAQ